MLINLSTSNSNTWDPRLKTQEDLSAGHHLILSVSEFGRGFLVVSLRKSLRLMNFNFIKEVIV